MALKVGPNSGLLVFGNPGEGHYDLLMRQWRWMDFFLNPNVLGVGINSPPGSPVDGATYILGETPTGAWNGQARKIARWCGDLPTPAWDFQTPKRGWATVYNYGDSKRYQFTGSVWEEFLSGSGGGGGGGGATADIIAAVTPADTVITTGVSHAFAPIIRAGNIFGVQADLLTASSSGTVTVDIKKNGTSILTTLLTIDATELSSLTAAVAAVLDGTQTSVEPGDRLTFQVTGAGTGAKDLVVSVRMSSSSSGGGGGGTWGSIGGTLADQTDLTAALAAKADDSDIAGLDTRIDALESSTGRYTANFGDGSAAEFDIDHNLGTRAVHVTVFRNATPWDTIICDVDRTTINRVKLYGFSGAPSADQYTVLVSK